VLRADLVPFLIVGENCASSLNVHGAVGVTLKSIFRSRASVLGKDLMIFLVVNEHG